MTKLSDRLEALAEKATKGPWLTRASYANMGTPDERAFGMIVDDDDFPTGIVDERDALCDESLSHDLDLIVELFNNLPTILQALKDKEL